MRKAKSSLSSSFNRVVSWIYPGKCPVCRRLSDQAPCIRCRLSLFREDLSYDCPVDMVDELRAAYPYQGASSGFVRALKYRRETSLIDFMAKEMVETFEKWDPDVDSVIPVPIHRSRLSERGFNQALVLCQDLPQEVIEKNLVRIRRTKPQVKLSPEERLKNLSGAFKCPESLIGKRILLVDDVFTTGATASECARALKEAGASWVGVLVFAVRRR